MELLPYAELARIHKPAGILLVAWPSLWGLTMAAYSTRMAFSEYSLLFLKCSGAAFIMRSSACTINDIFDRNFDASVERTRNRPLASGRVSLLGAIVFLLLQYAIALYFFATFNKAAFYANVLQMFPLSSSYPLMKRVTYWPQAWLGLAINFGFVASWAAVHGALVPRPGVVIYMMGALWCWTMAYDTIYACLDKKDDAKIGIGSSALFLERALVPVVVCFIITFIALLLVSGLLNSQGSPYFILCVGGAALFFLVKCTALDVDSMSSCWDFFVQNAYCFGFLMYAGLLLDYLRVIF